MAIRKEGLVYLVMDDGHVKVEEKCPEEVTVDIVDGTWTNKEYRDTFFAGHSDRKRKIGIDSRIAGQWWQRHGIIGVYDRTNIKDLKNMVSASIQADESDTSPEDY